MSLTNGSSSRLAKSFIMPHYPDFSKPVTLLAPMEGLTDPLMRNILTKIGQYDWMVSEFIRVTQTVLPSHVFFKYVPELEYGGKTEYGVPVHIQLLGSDATLMAENAQKACELLAPAIDLNFGCPAKTVNQHRGGSILLNEPETLYRIIYAVRQAVPQSVPVSAKIRLGYEDSHLLTEIVDAVEQANASWLTIHARTKIQGYKPPAYWHMLAPLRQRLRIPMIANGEIWTLEDAKQCRIQADTPHLMLGRGAVTRPDLVRQIQQFDSQTLCQHSTGMIDVFSWQKLLGLQIEFLHGQAKNDSVLVGRYKQWLGMLTQAYPEALSLWQIIKKEKSKESILQHLSSLAGTSA